MQRLCLVGGARPNFMKIAPIARELQARSGRFTHTLVHTGQHYDHQMSGVFFEELGIPPPDHFLDAGSGSHAQQTARIMTSFEPVCRRLAPDIVVVVGDVNSTLACSIVAKKQGAKVAHVEAGLRSGDLGMPEEINRIVTDSISDLFFVTEKSGVDNLLREGKQASAIHFVGHVMVDNLLYQASKLDSSDQSGFESPALVRALRDYAVVTLHRPSNVDRADDLRRIMGALKALSRRIPIVFPVHPRTRERLDEFGIDPEPIVLTAPLSYMDFLNLWKNARMVLTDSGGLQEETTALGVPCLTLRENTERPVTVSEGTNELVGTDPARISEGAARVLEGHWKRGARPGLWDGHAAQRIVDVLERAVPIERDRGAA
ncbi:MAG TPA: UDP-N-acetylglucosamine 2-epimerase (non-hydrolyzing) [Burkholderiales bacterium]|nr:UDP-N-acetylglucosamine 2-epimerase (non-hydrolyzing) [Burkholderiales bacterium]